MKKKKLPAKKKLLAKRKVLATASLKKCVESKNKKNIFLKQQEKEARQAHDLYWKSYINGDVKILASLLDNHYTQVGSVENEVFFNKKDAVKFVQTTIDQVAGNVNMRNPITKSEALDGFILVSDFDENIGNVNVVPHDIGRVILNLITNAFYVVDKKKKSGIENYEPTVSVITKKIRDDVLISVKDNGDGIKKTSREKYFYRSSLLNRLGRGLGWVCH